MSAIGPSPEERFEAWLDSQADGADAPLAAGEAEVNESALQARIENRLKQLFSVETPSQEELLALLRGAATADAPLSVPMARAPARGMVWRGAAAAALMAVAVGLSLWYSRGGAPEPVFAARPLAEIYRETVASGFEPYYECHEAERFAATFANRQGLALALRPLPEGARMLGLSYPGGLSRETTAMLCKVQGKPVMVFVDRAGADFAVAAADPGPELKVFRQQRYGLVFYEVTPLLKPHVADSLTRLDEGGDRWDESIAR